MVSEFVAGYSSNDEPLRDRALDFLAVRADTADSRAPPRSPPPPQLACGCALCARCGAPRFFPLEMRVSVRPPQERLLAGKDIRVKRLLKMLRFKDEEGSGAFEIGDFCASRSPPPPLANTCGRASTPS